MGLHQVPPDREPKRDPLERIGLNRASLVCCLQTASMACGALEMALPALVTLLQGYSKTVGDIFVPTHTRQQLLNTATTSLGFMPTGPRLVHPVDETAYLLGGISPWAVRKLYYTGQIKGHKVMGRLMIPRTEIDHFLASTKAPHEPASGNIVRALERKRELTAARRKAKATTKNPTQRKGGRTRAS